MSDCNHTILESCLSADECAACLREKAKAHSLHRAGSTFNRLRTALVNWRVAERKHATYVLRAAHPLDIRTAADAEAYALREVRLIVDSEPWSAILQDL